MTDCKKNIEILDFIARCFIAKFLYRNLDTTICVLTHHF